MVTFGAGRSERGENHMLRYEMAHTYTPVTVRDRGSLSPGVLSVM